MKKLVISLITLCLMIITVKASSLGGSLNAEIIKLTETRAAAITFEYDFEVTNSEGQKKSISCKT